MKRSIAHVAAALILPLMAGAALPAQASEKSDSEAVKALLKAVNEQAERLKSQEDKLKAQEAAIEQQKQNLAKEKDRFNQLKRQVATVTGKPVPADSEQTAEKSADKKKLSAKEAASASPSAGGAETTNAKSSGPQEVGAARKAEREKPPEIATLASEGGVLLRKGQLIVTPGIEYSRSSATRVEINGFAIIPALNIGNFEITQVSRDSLTASVGLRYGLFPRFEVDAKIPYVYRSDATKTRPIATPSVAETLSKVTGNNIGDVEFGAHYQMNDGQGGWPFLIANMRFKTITGTSPFDVPLNSNGLETELPTGTGFYAFQPSVTAILSSDPVVYYGNLGYLYNMKKDVGGTYGEIDPGDSVSGSFGMGLSLNDKSSFSVGYSHNTVFKTTQNGNALAGSSVLQVGSLDIGYSYNVTPDTNLNFTVSAGVTEDAPDVRLIFRTPITYSLR